ncbi:MAG TPA: hypothetical protein VGA22_08425 [Gemmatimonadales bacterium]|jgi:transposase
MVIGIDVAKQQLVVAVRPSGSRWTVANNEQGVASMTKRLDAHALAGLLARRRQLLEMLGAERNRMAPRVASLPPLVVTQRNGLR